MKNCPIKMWARHDYQVSSDSGIACDGPECAWCLFVDDQSWCAITFVATRLANLEVIFGRRNVKR